MELENLSLKELKAEFTRLTGLPAKKAFVVIAAPLMAECPMRSKPDWQAALSAIEFRLFPATLKFQSEDSFQEASHLPEEYSQPHIETDQKTDSEETVLLPEEHLAEYAAHVPDELVKRVVSTILLFDKGNIKPVYRTLARSFHPDSSRLPEKQSNRLFGILSNAFDDVDSIYEGWGSSYGNYEAMETIEIDLEDFESEF